MTLGYITNSATIQIRSTVNMVRSIAWANQETMDNIDQVLRLTGPPIFTHRLGRARNYQGWSNTAEARINDLELSFSQGGG
eukprot:1968392-Alexandrium_andersonii.AAC.1